MAAGAECLQTNHVCRTCLTMEHLSPIFNDVNHPDEHSRVLYLTTGLQIKFGDLLPQVICKDCIVAMESAIKFRKQSHEAEKILLKMLSFNSTSTVQSVEIHINDVKTEDIELKLETIDDKIDVINNIGEAWNTINNNEKRDFENNKGNCNTFENKNNKYNNKSEIGKDNGNESERYFKVVDNAQKPSKEGRLFFNIDNVLDNASSDDFEWKDDRDYTREKIKSKSNRNSPGTLYKKYQHLIDSSAHRSGLYRCKACNKMLKNYACFMSHAKRHYSCDFLCEVCGKMFAKSEALKRHCMALHGLQRAHLCPHCDYGGIDSTQLTLHIRREHTGDRPYVCDTCSASFRSKIQLVYHFAKHQTERTIKCPQCPSTFKTRPQLATHTHKVHTRRGWRAVCYICHKQYSKPILVKRHIVKEHAVPIAEQRPVGKVFEHPS